MCHRLLWGVTESKEVALELRHAYLVQRELVGEINCKLLLIRVKPFKETKHLVIGSVV